MPMPSRRDLNSHEWADELATLRASGLTSSRKWLRDFLLQPFPVTFDLLFDAGVVHDMDSSNYSLTWSKRRQSLIAAPPPDSISTEKAF